MRLLKFNRIFELRKVILNVSLSHDIKIIKIKIFFKSQIEYTRATLIVFLIIISNIYDLGTL
jgi:hypothetical protein